MIKTDIFASAYRRLRASLLPSEGEDAADALQEVFCRLWSRRSSLATQADVERMGARSLRNARIDEMRRMKFSSIEEVPEAAEVETPTDVSGLYQEVSALMRRELSERDRNILRLREACGWEFDELAERFGLSEANVRMIVSRARRTVRRAWENRYENEEQK